MAGEFVIPRPQAECISRSEGWGTLRGNFVPLRSTPAFALLARNLLFHS